MVTAAPGAARARGQMHPVTWRRPTGDGGLALDGSGRKRHECAAECGPSDRGWRHRGARGPDPAGALPPRWRYLPGRTRRRSVDGRVRRRGRGSRDLGGDRRAGLARSCAVDGGHPHAAVQMCKIGMACIVGGGAVHSTEGARLEAIVECRWFRRAELTRRRSTRGSSRRARGRRSTRRTTRPTYFPLGGRSSRFRTPRGGAADRAKRPHGTCRVCLDGLGYGPTPAGR
jgi:hypothetical protein